MAKARIVPVNRPMAEALRKMMRIDQCPICDLSLMEHSKIAIMEKSGEVITCSNDRNDKRRRQFLGK